MLGITVETLDPPCYERATLGFLRNGLPMLSPYRVLDLSDERGLLCGQLLADMGADVIKVEPPGGSPARRRGPFYEDSPSAERSLYWWAYNRNKRAVTLDIEDPEGRELLARMVSRADFFIESFTPGYLSALGLGYADLGAINPRLIYVSISAFGQDGPKAGWAESDLVVLAAGGPLVITGDDDRPPVRLGVPQAYLHASTDAAIGALAAHHESVRSGRGQHVDVSAQQSVAMATQSYILSAALDSPELTRISGGIKLGAIRVPLVWPAKDGHVALVFLFGSALGVFTRKLMEYICEQGFCDEATRDKDWVGYLEMLMSGEESIEEWERVKAVVSAFTSSRTKAELLGLTLSRGFLIAPVSTIREVVESPQLKARDFWRQVEHPELGASFLYPGPFAKFTETPLNFRRRPPLVGEHNEEIYRGELGLSEADLTALREQRVI